MRLLSLILIVMLFAQPLRAEVAPVLPDPMLKRIKAAPDRFMDLAALLIHGFGSGGSIDIAGIERSIALDRAGTRASAQRRLLAADLDGDGTVGSGEISVAANAASATTRARLITTHARADADSDGSVSPAELAAHAGAESLRQVSEADAAMARAVLACDQDGDGQVTMPEVKRALAALDAAA
jgi:hypothetical protein